MENEQVMILDLNQQPHDSATGLDSILNELESAHGRIEERIRQLEAVTVRQRRRWRQSLVPPQVINITPPAPTPNQQHIQTALHDDATTGETAKTNIPESTHLIAKALASDTNPKRVEPCVGSFFDCNICLGMATDPILTCCGHLFCWPCFYQLSYADSIAKECPVCKGEVSDASIIPVYGHGDCKSSRNSKESVSVAPPRPRAARIEGVRQQIIRRGPSSIIEHRIQLLRNLVAMGEGRQTQDLFGSHTNAMAERNSVFPSRYTSPAAEASSTRQHDTLQVSRLLMHRAASVSSLSSALNTAMDSAERLVEDLEAFSNDPWMRRNRQQSPSHDNGVTSSNIAIIIQPENLTSDTATEINSDVLPAASFLRSFPASAGLQDQTLNSETSSTVRSSSSRRRSFQRGSGVIINQHSSEPRRRRLR
ncbi:uncharacterized protein LOC126802485 [Argentina anserina]|uniref:uncharacterized protein LOC126802485 n=1 Tax=Argentina anserina TaxID=57926 RepID=UPI0021766C44|nr:uncharacterized protein LOC126802485 [Potentilla anserina]XP_050386081.1 uncharacterized protein LOC126802485 [Potentilla anserina]